MGARQLDGVELALGVQLKGVVLALGVRHDEIQRAQQVRLKGVQERRLGGGDRRDRD